MLKNKFKVIALLAILILALTLPIVKAENETITNMTTDASLSEQTASNETALPISNDSETNISMDEDNFKKSDVYLMGNDITIDYIVDGNLFIFANNVTINSQIGGDAFIFANTVTLGDQSYIHSNLFTFCKDVNINGVIYDLYTASENTTIHGYVCRDIHVASDTVNISGIIKRNAYIDCSTLNFTSNANESTQNTGEQSALTTQTMIYGNLNYSAKTESSIPENVVSGETTFEQQKTFDTNVIQEKLISLATFVLTIIAVWLVCLWLAPKFLKTATSFLTTKKIMLAIGLGILTPIVSILLTVLFFSIEIASTLGLLLLMTLFTLITISTSIFAITLNTIICNKLKIEKNIAIFGMLVATSIALWLIGLIPFIGFILGIIVVILGLGIVVSNLILKEKAVE